MPAGIENVDEANRHPQPPTMTLEGRKPVLIQPIENENVVIEAMDSEDENDFDFGFYDGMELEKILGLTKNNGKLFFLIKWKNQVSADLVPKQLIHERYPQLTIAYYESIFRFTDT
ncbi:chromobox protein homolog 1-like [Rhopalosiphum padi]|uniref:chromobox protein homolog 1-like n=1 Tax=Rhopalosiphum padi TaxID=40932 RepID=UPI00298E7273|nr:chromobox protein homolog 1-like [Rhopalosiphum padi]